MQTKLPRNSTFVLEHLDRAPEVPGTWRLCPGCFDPMMLSYAWKSSEHVIHMFFVCHCGTKSKGKLLHFRLDRNGKVTR